MKYILTEEEYQSLKKSKEDLEKIKNCFNDVKEFEYEDIGKVKEYYFDEKQYIEIISILELPFDIGDSAIICGDVYNKNIKYN